MKKHYVEPSVVWYEELGYKKNPLSIKPSLGPNLLGMSVVMEQVVEEMNHGKCVFLQGEYGAGKTSFLQYLIQKFGGRKRVIYFSANRLRGPLDVERLLYERFGFFTRLFKIKSKNMVLLLDEAHCATKKDFDALFDYHKKGFFSTMVFVTHDIGELPLTEKKLASWNTYTFGKLDKDTAVELIQQRISHPLLSPQVIEEIFALDTKTRHFLKNCDVFMRHMVAQGRKTAKPKDVQKVFS